jgi:hypothetical protein
MRKRKRRAKLLDTNQKDILRAAASVRLIASFSFSSSWSLSSTSQSEKRQNPPDPTNTKTLRSLKKKVSPPRGRVHTVLSDFREIANSQNQQQGGRERTSLRTSRRAEENEEEGSTVMTKSGQPGLKIQTFRKRKNTCESQGADGTDAVNGSTRNATDCRDWSAEEGDGEAKKQRKSERASEREEETVSVLQDRVSVPDITAYHRSPRVRTRAGTFEH